MNLSRGNFRIWMLSFLCIFVTSCVFIRNEKPLNPRLLFTVGSEFLESAESVALKGEIQYKNAGRNQSGSFQLVLNHGDSLAMVIEGPLNVDVFRLIIVDQMAYAWDRDSDRWTAFVDSDKELVSDYGIESISPDHFGFYLLPQFYLNNELHLDPEQMTLYSDDFMSYIQRSGSQTSFSVSNKVSNLSILYGKRSDFGGGYYPSVIKISSPGKDWLISTKIERIRLNPHFSSQFWERN